MKRTPMKPGKPLQRKTPMAPPRAAMRARRPGKRATKTVYRNRALLDLAQGQACTLLVPGWCLGHSKSARDTTVACHSNLAKHGKGAGIKAHDWAIAFGCYGCHFYIDQSGAPAEDKVRYFELGLAQTRQAVMAMGKWPEEAERGYQLLYGSAP
ncbi:nuclease domain-containing protein [Bordetella trematum]|uniref:nuclease domain-containing protein n=1 Tax=Bordetella trematum TaxID=123899 RepID=UPI0015C5243A|nr:nuclease domain-containing protein [Bordetella trematum]